MNNAIKNIALSLHVESLDEFCTTRLETTLNSALRTFAKAYQLSAFLPEWVDISIQNLTSDPCALSESETLRWKRTLWRTVRGQIVDPFNPNRTLSAKSQILVDLPRMTERASFIVDGVERTPVAQLLPARGLTISFSEDPDGTQWGEAILRPKYGATIVVSVKVTPTRKRTSWTISVDGNSGPLAAVAAHMGWADSFSALCARISKMLKGNDPESDAEDTDEQPGTPLPIQFPREILLILGEDEARSLDKALKGVLIAKNEADSDAPGWLRPYHVEAMIKAIEARILAGTGTQLAPQDDPENLASSEILLVGDHLERALWRGIHRFIARLKRREERPQQIDVELVFQWLWSLMQREVLHYLRGPLCPPLDRTNPLAEVSHKRKVTRYGPGGLPSDYHGLAFRDVHASHYGRLCPVETPESEKLGLTLHLASYARVKNRQIEAPFLVSGQEAPVWMGPLQDAETLSEVAEAPKIPRLLRSALPDQEIVSGETATPGKTDLAPGLQLGLAASLIPFIQHDDLNRALMGAKNLKQALPLKRPELPLIRTGFEEVVGRLSGRAIRSTWDGRVTTVSDQEVIVGETRHSIPTETEGWLGSRLSYRPVVKVDDVVRAGDMLADGPAMVNGQLALGVNLLVAYLPWYGYNFEDGIVISDRLVREGILTSLHCYSVEVTPKSNEQCRTPALTEAADAEAVETFDESDVIRCGTAVKEADPIARLWRNTQGGYEPVMVKAPLGVKGTVVAVEPIGHRRGWKITIANERPVTVGDKLMGRHGNKGVITKIVPEASMPHLEDGTPVDVLLNPLGVVGRLNLGQLIETHCGLVIKRNGEDHRLYGPFQSVDLNALRDELKAVKAPDGKLWLTDGFTGKRYESPVAVGYQYMVKLNHLAEVKAQGRETGDYASVTQQAIRGRVNKGGQRIGEMETWALLAHGAQQTLSELIGPRGDDLRGRRGLAKRTMNARWSGGDQIKRSIPESFRVFLSYLRGMGLEPSAHGLPLAAVIAGTRSMEPDSLKEISVTLADDEAIQEWGKQVDETPWRVKREWATLSCGCEGYLDEILLSTKPLLCKHPKHSEDISLNCGHRGTSTAIIQFDSLKRRICAQCGTRVTQITRHTKKKEWIKREGNVRSEMGFAKGGIFSESVFGAADDIRLHPCGHIGRPSTIVEVRFDPACEHISRPRKILAHGKGWSRWCRVCKKTVKAVQRCRDCERPIRSVEPAGSRRVNWGVIHLVEEVRHPLTLDLDPRKRQKTIRFIPVLPPSLRPYFRDKAEADSDLNRLYERVIDSNNELARQLKASETDPGNQQIVQLVQKARTNLQKSVDALMVDGLTLDGRHYRSIMEHLRGKEGLVRQALLGRRIDASGRAVIVSAPFLAPDQVALPRLLAEEVFGMPGDQIQELLDDVKNPVRVILNRQPSLHRYSMLALRPVLWDQTVIGLPPLITSGFNADFDGDTMAFYLPILSRADADSRLAPKAHIRSVANGEVLVASGHEIAAGIRKATLTDVPPLLKASGYADGPLDQKGLKAHIESQWDGSEARPKPGDVLDRAQELATLAFGEATRAGLSFGHFDLDAFYVDRATRETLNGDHQAWTKAVEHLVKSKVLDHKVAETNPMRLFFSAGTKLSLPALRQMAGGRGLIDRLRIDPLRGDDAVFVGSNLYEGMHPLEFFSSAHGSRSSLKDKKLGVALTGTFTRHLVHAAFDLRITDGQCNDDSGIALTDLLSFSPPAGSGPALLSPRIPLSQRAVGRVVIGDIGIGGEFVKNENKKGKKGKAKIVVIDDAMGQALEGKVFSLRVRSPLTCKAGPGRICRACYGWDPSTKALVEPGAWVGIIAGQSIGERATQLTFRTFHSGGAAGGTQLTGFGKVRRLFSRGSIPIDVDDQGRSLWECVRRWEEQQGRTPFQRVSFPEFRPAPRDPENPRLSSVLAMGHEARLSAFLGEFNDAYKGAVYEKHAEVMLRALKDATKAQGPDAAFAGLQTAAAAQGGVLGRMAFGDWSGVLKILRPVPAAASADAGGVTAELLQRLQARFADTTSLPPVPYSFTLSLEHARADIMLGMARRER